MSIKLKGEAIKEGSIPFSALSDEIKNKLSNDKYKKLDWHYHDYAGGYAAESQTNKIIINEKEYDLTDETVGIAINNKEYGFTYNDYNEIYYVIVYGADEEDIDILTNNVFILNNVEPITLDSLGDDVKKELDGKLGLCGYYGSLGKNVKNIDTDMYRMGTVFIVQGDNFRELGKGTYDLSAFFSGPSAILNVYEKGTCLSLELQDTIGYWDGIDVYKMYIKPPQETPDWNAQKGEPGYIENSIFQIRHGDYGDEVTKDLLEQYKLNLDEFEEYTRVNDYGEEFTRLRKEIEGGGTSNQILHNIHNVGSGNFIKGGFILQSSKEIYFGDYGKITFYEEYIDDKPYITINWDDDSAINELPNFDVYIIPEWDPFYIAPLSLELLPNTVIKTTHQFLSNTEKNQALTNLGIDPVVWNYMLSPYNIYIGDSVPNNMLLKGKLKPMPTCCYYIDDAIDGYPGIILQPANDEGQLLVVHNKSLYYYYADENGNWARVEY